jgi:hypothetical protein
MLSKSGVTRLQGIIIILIIIGASIVTFFIYDSIQPAPTPQGKAEFQLSNLTINPETAEPNQFVGVVVEVTNVGTADGDFSTELFINDSLVETKNVQVKAGLTEIVGFTVSEAVEGNYTLRIGDLTGSLSVRSLPAPTPSPTPLPTNTPIPSLIFPVALKLANLVISPFEAWANETVAISANVSNVGDVPINFSVPFKVNNLILTAQNTQFLPGETTRVEVNITESDEGTYTVVSGGSTSTFQIVPNGTHTLLIRTYDGLPFTLNGQSYVTPFNRLLDVGTYTISMLAQYDYYNDPQHPLFVRHYKFQNWDDGSSNPVRTINLANYTVLIAGYAYSYSCPSLYVWNGTSYVSNGDVSSDGGWLGFIDHYGENGSIVFAYSNPWDYIKLSSQTQARNGYFDLALVEQADEIYYFDSAELLAVDHPKGTDVFSTAKTYIYQLDNLGEVYSVSKNPALPVSAVDGNGLNLLPQISKADGITTYGNLWKWDALQLDLGNLSGAKEIKLIITGTSVWQAGSGSNWNAQYVNKSGVTPQPPPYMEVKDANGSWIKVPDNRQFPILTAPASTIVVDLTGLFPTSDYSLRINSFQDMRFDFIGIDTTPQQKMIIQTAKPNYGELSQTFSEESNSSGNFTRYGDVLSLILNADNELVVGRIGDLVSLRFPDNFGPVAEGMERDYFFVSSLWFKARWVQNQPYTVDPMPFQAMSGYPYPSNESFPTDASHVDYIQNYNTRRIDPQ